MSKQPILWPLLFMILASCTPATSSSEASSSFLSYEDQLYANSVSWGLGTAISAYVSADRDYEWYVDQATTGTYWNVNCGPTSVEMAGRWADADFAYTAEDARASYRPTGGWWYDTDIHGALTQFAIPHSTSTISSSSDLTTLLDGGGIILVNPDMSEVNEQASDTERVGRYYSGITGHYLIVKGYVVVDSNTFFEVYDPWSAGATYADETLKGKNRYYDAVSFTNSLLLWYTKVYTITQITD